MGSMFGKCNKNARKDSFFDLDIPYTKYGESAHRSQLRKQSIKPVDICSLNCFIHNQVRQKDIDYFVDNVQWSSDSKQSFFVDE